MRAGRFELLKAGENLPGRRLRSDQVERVAEEEAKRFAREEEDKLDSEWRTRYRHLRRRNMHR
jgi:hypothetical protein